MTIKKPLAKFAALVPLSIGAAFIAVNADRYIFAKLDSKSARDYVESQRQLFPHSFFHHFIVWLLGGALYIAGVEFIAFVIELLFKKRTAGGKAV